MKLTKEVLTLLNDQEASKVLTTVSSNGVPHSIVVGSLMAPNETTICVAEILMNKTSNNLEQNETISVLTVKGKESYLINANIIEKQTEGELFSKVEENLKKVGLPIKGLWLFKPTAIFNQSATMDAGKQIL